MNELTRLAGRFQALSDPSRLRLLRFIGGGEPTASACVQYLDQSQPRVARHLRVLVDAGVVVARRSGRFIHYALADAGAGQILARAALSAIQAEPGPPPAPTPVAVPVTRASAPLAPAAAPGHDRVAPHSSEPPDPPARPPMEDYLL